MFERFTAAARDTVLEAAAQAKAQGSSQIRPEHLLLAMLGPGGFLTRQGLSYEEARALVGAAGGADEERDARALRAIGIDLDQGRGSRWPANRAGRCRHDRRAALRSGSSAGRSRQSRAADQR